MKYFTLEWPDSGTRFWIIVVCVDTLKLFKNHETFSRIILNSKFQYSINFLVWHGQTQAQIKASFQKIYLFKKERRNKAMRQHDFRKCKNGKYRTNISQA